MDLISAGLGDGEAIYVRGDSIWVIFWTWRSCQNRSKRMVRVDENEENAHVMSDTSNREMKVLSEMLWCANKSRNGIFPNYGCQTSYSSSETTRCFG